MSIGLPSAAIDLLAWLVDRETDGGDGPLALDLPEHDMRGVRRYLPRLVLYGLAESWREVGQHRTSHWGRPAWRTTDMLHARPTALGVAMIRASRTTEHQNAAK